MPVVKDWTKKVAPKDVRSIIEALAETAGLRTKDPAVPIPSVTLVLANGSSVSGTLLDYDWDKDFMTLLDSSQQSYANVTMLHRSQVYAVILTNPDVCPEFLEKLSAKQCRSY